jgi:acetyl esterase/lipase
MLETFHPLADKDREFMSAVRIATAPFKGKLAGPSARGPFDAVISQTTDADGISYEVGSVGGVTGVWCRPSNGVAHAAILYLHGGAYVLGSAHAYRSLVGQIAARARVAAFVPDYRLAPEHPFPAAVEDAQAVYSGLVEGGAKTVAIVGDSAGGGLALVLLSLAMAKARATDGLAPCAVVALSPWTDLALTGPSYQQRAEADPVLTPEALATSAQLYLNGTSVLDPMASPLYGNVMGLPPIQIHVGVDEVLLDDARQYAEKTDAAGVETWLHVWEGMPHVFPRNVGKLSAADQAMDLIGAFLRKQLVRSSI